MSTLNQVHDSVRLPVLWLCMWPALGQSCISCHLPWLHAGIQQKEKIRWGQQRNRNEGERETGRENYSFGGLLELLTLKAIPRLFLCTRTCQYCPFFFPLASWMGFLSFILKNILRHSKAIAHRFRTIWVFRAVVLKLELVHPEFLVQKVWSGDHDLVFLTSSWMIPMLWDQRPLLW